MKFNDWEELLDQWCVLLRPHLDILNQEAIEYGAINREVKGLRNSPCSVQEIELVESKLNTSLPDSYKQFLLHSNGANTIERPMLFLPIQKVDWYRNYEPKDNIEIWVKDTESAPDEKYFVYGKFQDCVHMRPEYLKHCLAVSTYFEGDMYLLNPCIKQASGEWEAWWLGYKNPGAVRFRTFWDLMVERLHSVESYLER